MLWELLERFLLSTLHFQVKDDGRRSQHFSAEIASFVAKNKLYLKSNCY
jgi:hypothetical protein